MENDKMKKTIGIICYVIASCIGIGVTLINPDMADGRLLFTYWWLYLIAFALVVNGALLIRDDDED